MIEPDKQLTVAYLLEQAGKVAALPGRADPNADRIDGVAIAIYEVGAAAAERLEAIEEALLYTQAS